jgi:hypothetical protein
MKFIKQILFGISLIFIMSGCSMKGVEFTPDFNSINDLKDANLKSISVKKNNVGIAETTTSISVGRGTNVMTSPYGGTFQEYLEISLKEELQQASIYNENSNIEITTKLLKNTLNTGLSTGTAELSANFVIQINKEEVFNKIYEIRHEWESSFVAATAIPVTLNNYPIAMQKLIDKFLINTNVQKILKK